MTDRELAGCADVMVKAIKNRVEWLRRMSDHGRYMRIPSGISAGQAFELAHELSAFADDYAALLAKYEALLSRTPSSEGNAQEYQPALNPAGTAIENGVAPLLSVDCCPDPSPEVAG